MRLYEQLASRIIGTPLQQPAEGLRWLSQLPRRLRHPELREVFLEGDLAKKFIKQTIVDGMNCVDIGCHLGSVLQEIVSLSPSGTHLGAEPLPYKAAWLRKKFPNVEIKENALSDQPGSVEFFHDSSHSGFSGLRVHATNGASTKSVIVECVRLDDIVPPERRIGFIKVDVEGGETLVLKGARRILADSRPVILFECTRSGISGFDLSPSQVYSLFRDEFGYDISLIKSRLGGLPPLSLDEFESSMSYPFQAFNYVASPR